MGWQFFGGKRIDAGRIDADQSLPLRMQSLHEFRTEGSEILVELFWVWIGAGKEQDARRGNGFRDRLWRDDGAAGHGDTDYLTPAQVIIQVSLIDGWRVRAVMTGSIGVRA